jgi:putative membrane protein
MLLLAHASGKPWEWHSHPDVWALIALVAIGYIYALTRLGPRLLGPGQKVVTRRQVATITTGIILLWVASDYPIHDIAEEYLMSVHMVQHLLLTLAVPGILLAGTPDWLLRWLLVRPRAVHALVSRLGKPLIAGLIFNIVTAVTHWPAMVNMSLEHHALHFVVHTVMFTTAALMWLPVLSRLPELPTMSDPAKMVYLFLQSVLPTIPASFLTFAQVPLYRYYAHAPRIWGMSAVEDQQLAGAIMKVIGGAVLWAVIATMFFRWYAREERSKSGELTWDDVERELQRTGPAH